jgi:hypothetical protein
MRQKSLVEVQQAQKMAELTGSLGRVAVQEIGYCFFQSSGTLGGYLVTEEGDLGCSEDSLCQVVEDPILLKLIEESP